MINPLVVIHGWSDDSASFEQLANLIKQQLNRQIQFIDLADYISMDDEITFPDLITTMRRAWEQNKLPLTPGSVDVIGHSTAGLIIRHWLVHNFTGNTAPIKRLLLLAPANFGSQLAHRGRAFIGRIIKGLNSPKIFNVGAQLLKGLELASPYSWWLAMQDRFDTKNTFYDVGKILCTVLIGNTGYSGIASAANEEGSDGTVRVACANLNCGFLEADFVSNPLQPQYRYVDSTGITAFGIVEGETHASITGRAPGFNNPNTLNLIVQALTVTDANFSQWCEQLNGITQQVMQQNIANSYKHGFQNTVVYVNDQLGQNPEDYFLEFFAEKNGQWFSEKFYQDVISSVHAYGDNSNYRSVYIDCTEFYQHLMQDWQQVNFTLTAYPELMTKGNVVGYQTLSGVGAIKINQDEIQRWFIENRTLLVRMTIRREQAANVFKLTQI